MKNTILENCLFFKCWKIFRFAGNRKYKNV